MDREIKVVVVLSVSSHTNVAMAKDKKQRQI